MIMVYTMMLKIWLNSFCTFCFVSSLKQPPVNTKKKNHNDIIIIVYFKQNIFKMKLTFIPHNNHCVGCMFIFHHKNKVFDSLNLKSFEAFNVQVSYSGQTDLRKLFNLSKKKMVFKKIC